MNKKTDKNSEIFKEAMRGVSPLKPINTIPRIKPTLTKSQKKKESSYEYKLPLSDHCSVDITHNEFLSYAKPGMQPRYIKQLKQGKIAIEAELDLHGYTIDEAREIFSEFMVLSQEQGLRCIRIIHGKGSRAQTKIPLMKNKVFAWLSQMPNILAFVSCQPKDGGTGALYVLLQRE